MTFNLGQEISLTILTASLLTLLLFLPLPGKDISTSISFEEKNYSFEMVDENTLEDGSWGVHDMVSNDIKVATGNLPIYQFLSVCSHEVKHLKLSQTHNLNTQQEHNLMKGVNSAWIPVNWETQCLKLLPQRT